MQKFYKSNANYSNPMRTALNLPSTINGDDNISINGNATVKDRRKMKAVPLLRCYLGDSAGSGKSTTLRTVLQHLRLLFQKESIAATVELTAYTGVAALNSACGRCRLQACDRRQACGRCRLHAFDRRQACDRRQWPVTEGL